MFSEHWFLRVLGKGSCHGDLAVSGANAIMALNNPQPTEFGAPLRKGFPSTEIICFTQIQRSSVSAEGICHILVLYF